MVDDPKKKDLVEGVIGGKEKRKTHSHFRDTRWASHILLKGGTRHSWVVPPGEKKKREEL
jgi:hypothetical protein